MSCHDKCMCEHNRHSPTLIHMPLPPYTHTSTALAPCDDHMMYWYMETCIDMCIAQSRVVVHDNIVPSLVPRPPPVFVLRFVFSIIHGSGRPCFFTLFHFRVLLWTQTEEQKMERGYIIATLTAACNIVGSFFTYMAVPGRNRTLFRCVFRLCYRVQSAVAQYFR